MNHDSTDASKRYPQEADGAFANMFSNLKDCLADVWSLEVNTMIVSRIGGFKFNPYTAYENLFYIPTDKQEFLRLMQPEELKKDTNKLPSYIVDALSINDPNLAGGDILNAPNTRRTSQAEISAVMDSYIILRLRLQRVFNYEPTLADIRKSIQKTRNGSNHDPLSISPSPNPDTGGSLSLPRDPDVLLPLPTLADAIKYHLFDNGVFIRQLRSLRELYYLLAADEAAHPDNIYDIISAQTIVQMDGDVMNRFQKALFTSDEREFLLETHQKAITTGQQNWKSLISLIIESIKTLSGFLVRT